MYWGLITHFLNPENWAKIDSIHLIHNISKGFIGEDAKKCKKYKGKPFTKISILYIL